jgi:gamma-glutamyltranspeptidase/glutathione hydrolase
MLHTRPVVKAPLQATTVKWGTLVASALALAACASVAPVVEPPAPSRKEDIAKPATSVIIERPDPSRVWRFGSEAMVAAADPRAAEAGLEMLRQGGNATDAAIATMLVLGLVEPQSAGIGGGGFWLNYERESGAVSFFNGRETAPATATPDMFFVDGVLPSWVESWLSGMSVGAPGLVPMMFEVHAENGRLPWDTLIKPAVKLAEEGFEISPDLHSFVVMFADRSRIKKLPEARAYFFNEVNGVLEPKPIGSKIVNAAYAETLRRIAAEGPTVMTTGEIARNIAAAVANDPARPGRLTEADISAYKPDVEAPVCGPFREFTVCTSPPPGSGVAVLQILALIEQASPKPLQNNAEGWATFITASQLAYSDRDHYVADDAFVPVPLAGLMDPRYVATRAADVGTAPLKAIGPGDPSLILGGESLFDRWGRDPAPGTTGTTHLSVIDSEGNAVALTATVEALFGNQMMVNGFFLNNQLTDFAREGQKGGKPLANAAAPRKRPRSSMSPTIVFDAEGNVRLITGSPGGNNIVAYVAKSIVASLDMNMTPQEAADTANIIARTAKPRVEKTLANPTIIAELKALGHDIQETEGERSGLHIIGVQANGEYYDLMGGADPRRGGSVERIIWMTVPAN